MIKLKLILIFLLLYTVSSSLNAQSFTTRIGGGFYFYNLSNLKSSFEVMKSGLNSTQIPAKITDMFPNRITGQIGINYRATSYSFISFFYGYQETGGRLHYKDFSGEYDYSVTLKRRIFGMDLLFVDDNRFLQNLSFGIGNSYLFTFQYKDIFSYYQINGQVITNDKTQSQGDLLLGYLPHINVGYSFYTVNLNVQFGYEFMITFDGFMSNLYNEKAKSASTAEFSGYRIDLLLSIDPFQYF